VFTRVFARELTTAGLTLVQLAKRTQTTVKSMAAGIGHEQTPAYYDQVVGDVMLNGKPAETPTASATPAADGTPAAGASAAATTQVAALPGAGALAAPGGAQTRREDTSPTPEQRFAELDALAAAGSWRELHDHLTDISPTSRDAHWSRLVEQAAVGELNALTAPGGNAGERLATIARYYPEFPSLGDSTQFLALRMVVGLDAFARCFDETQYARQCRDDLERFVHVAPVSVELARGAAKLVRTKFDHRAAPLFYAIGLEAPGGEAVCTESTLANDLVAGLQLPPEAREARAARALTDRCWDSVQATVVANVARESPGNYYLQNACPTLLQHGALTGLREKNCKALTTP